MKVKRMKYAIQLQVKEVFVEYYIAIHSPANVTFTNHHQFQHFHKC